MTKQWFLLYIQNQILSSKQRTESNSVLRWLRRTRNIKSHYFLNSVSTFPTRHGICSTKTIVKAPHVVQALSQYRNQNKQRICGVLSTHMDPELGHCVLIIRVSQLPIGQIQSKPHILFGQWEQFLLCSAWGRITGTESGVMHYVPSGVCQNNHSKKKKKKTLWIWSCVS